MNKLNLLSIALTISSDRESLRYTYQKFESSNNIKILLTTQQIAWKQIEHEKKTLLSQLYCKFIKKYAFCATIT